MREGKRCGAVSCEQSWNAIVIARCSVLQKGTAAAEACLLMWGREPSSPWIFPHLPSDRETGGSWTQPAESQGKELEGIWGVAFQSFLFPPVSLKEKGPSYIFKASAERQSVVWWDML